MGSLKDEAYEKLDYLSQLTEVVVGPQNEVLAKIPDRIELDFITINSIKLDTWGSGPSAYELSPVSVLFQHVSEEEAQYVRDIEDNFEFEFSEDLDVDFANRSMTGTLALVKKTQQIDEKKLLQLAVDKSTRSLHQHQWSNKRLKEKVATVLNIFEPNKGTQWLQQLEGRVAWQALSAIRSAISDTILENKWRIRDTAVIVKIGEWINSYLTNESETSVGLVNLIKLKIMVEKDRPIYSIGEVT